MKKGVIFQKKNIYILTRFKRVRTAGTYGDVGTGPHQFLSDTLNQLQPEKGSGEANYALDIPFNLSASSFKKQNIVSFNLEEVMVQTRISYFKIILRKIQRKFDKRLLLCCKDGCMKF